MPITVSPNKVINQIIDVICVIDSLTDISLGHLVSNLFLAVTSLLILNAVCGGTKITCLIQTILGVKCEL